MVFLGLGKGAFFALLGSVPSYFLCLEQYTAPFLGLQVHCCPELAPFEKIYGQYLVSL